MHLSPSTIARMLAKPPAPKPAPPKPQPDAPAKRVVTAKRPNHVWHVDLTAVPIGGGFWTQLAPIRLAAALAVLLVGGRGRRPFLAPSPGQHHVLLPAVVEGGTCVLGPHDQQDRPARRNTSSATAASNSIMRRLPHVVQTQRNSAAALRRARASTAASRSSSAASARSKNTCAAWPAIPFSRRSTQRELNLIAEWYNEHRPHETLGGRTPNEVFYDRSPANRRPRYEPRERWPRGSPCAKPWALVRGRPGAQLELEISHHGGRRHLPIVTLRRVA